MRKFNVKFNQNSENVVNCFSKDSDDIKYTTDELLSPDEDFVVIKTIKAICQASVLLREAYNAYKSKDYETFNVAVNFLKAGIVKDIKPTFNSVQDNFSRYSAIQDFDVEIDYKTLDISISTLPIPISIMMFGGEIRQLEWIINLAALKAACKK